MVNHIDIHALNLDELTGVVNLYPWYAAARLELCRRMFAMGENAWSEEEFAAQALYVADRGKFSDLVRGIRRVDCSDKDAETLLAAYMEPTVTATEAPVHSVRVVGGDYFSQAQYDKVREGSDHVFSRLAGRPQGEVSVQEEDTTEIAERFATETLAQIFVEQGRYEEAKRIYSRLILDIPEKSAYFASLIDKLSHLD
jgi:hypothetical protein